MAPNLAVANLLRAANTDLADAQMLMRRGGQGRNAALIANRAFSSLVKAVAASEHGWPLDEWHSDVRAIPDVNPLRQDLDIIAALLDSVVEDAVQDDGEQAPDPDTDRLSDAVDRIGDLVTTASNAFGTDLDGSGPAANVEPIRPPPPAEPEPTVEQTAPIDRDEAEARTAASSRPSKGESQGAMTEEGRQGDSTHVPRRLSVVESRSPKQGRRARRQSPPLKYVVTPPPGEPQGPPKEEPQTAPPSHVGSPAIEPSTAANDYPSTAFWSLADRWKLSDTEALDLIGHAGGLTRKGTRPRFRVKGQEAEVLRYLQEIDAALTPVVQDVGTWMRQPIKEAPFGGSSPLSHIKSGGVYGARNVVRMVLKVSLGT